MKFIELRGARVPALGLGTWPLSGDECMRAVRDALALGYRHIDTAQIYGNEAEVGKAIGKASIAREDLWITTKLGPGSLAAKDVLRSVEESLRKLRLDHVDLLLIHWPSRTVPMAETLAAMAGLREAGKTRFLGVSNFTVKLLDEAIGRHGADLLCNQVEYHPFLSQRAVLAAAHRHGLMLTAYSPVARGRVNDDLTLKGLAAKYGKTPAQISLRWLMEQDGVAAVPKSARRAHLAANLSVFDFALAPEDHAAIDALAENHRIVDIAGWAPDWDQPG
jgi:2,5-diketo-D-gluconate reductase B